MNDKGSIDLIQLIVGLMIIAIAALGATKIHVYGWDTQDWEIRHKKALSMARSEVEYIQGRINCDFDENDRSFGVGNHTRPEQRLLDERDPTTISDDIYCKVSHSHIKPVDLPLTGLGVDFYKFDVIVTWLEPNETTERVVMFQGAML